MKVKDKTCTCGCGNQLPEGRSRFYSKSCHQRYHNKKRKAYRRGWKRKKRRMLLGRVCYHCEKTDQETTFDLKSVCNNCLKQLKVNKCRRCGAPFYPVPKKGTDQGCVAKCRDLLWEEPKE